MLSESGFRTTSRCGGHSTSLGGELREKIWLLRNYQTSQMLPKIFMKAEVFGRAENVRPMGQILSSDKPNAGGWGGRRAGESAPPPTGPYSAP